MLKKVQRPYEMDGESGSVDLSFYLEIYIKDYSKIYLILYNLQFFQIN